MDRDVGCFRGVICRAKYCCDYGNSGSGGFGCRNV